MTDISFLGDTPLERLSTLMKRLRAPNGCAWDKEQTFATIAPYTIEEAYEVADAITRENMPDLKEELGDLLFQVVFHSQMADEQDVFNLEQVCDALTEKMVRRHPHVFIATDDRSADDQVLAWEEVKAQERAEKQARSGEIVSKPKGVLDDVALALPALMRAEKLQKRAARVGFDWPDTDGVLDKIIEEAREVEEAVREGNPHDIEGEMGDLIFAVTNLARKLGVDPEVALRRTNDKFTARFEHVERVAQSEGRDVSDMSLDEMEAAWQAAKKL